MLIPIITFHRLKRWYPFQTIGLRLQVDHMSHKKNKFFKEYDDSSPNTIICIILRKHREHEMISDGSKVASVQVI